MTENDEHIQEVIQRVVHLNNPNLNSAASYPSNKTSTTKYTPYNFIFKNLFEQFRRLANVYFLVVCIIELIPTISPLSPLASILPLVFVLSVTAIKDGYEDWKRHKADDEVNNRRVMALRSDQWVEIAWRDVVVGDMLQLVDDEMIPADVVPISCSNPTGQVFIETANLDGETGNKLRNCVHFKNNIKKTLVDAGKDASKLSQVGGQIAIPPPNIHLDSFDAKFIPVETYTDHRDHALELDNVDESDSKLSPEHDEGGNEIPLTENNILLRGAVIKITDWVNVIVVYTGEETKLVLNQQDAPSKFTHVERTLNRYVFGLFLFVILLCIVSAMLALLWQSERGIKAVYLYISPVETSTLPQSLLKFGREFLSFFVLYSNIIPISLYVSMEFVKLCGSILISYDSDMYDEASQYGILIKTSNLLEELGQVTHVFTDKTGTLTENRMTLKKCSINGKMFHSSKLVMKVPSPSLNDESIKDDKFIKVETRPEDILDEEEIFTRSLVKKDETVHNFFFNMVANHAINVRILDNNDLEYNSSSPDEEALVGGIIPYGFHLEDRTDDCVTFHYFGKKTKLEVLDMIEFSSDRKRMSVIIRDEQGKIRLLCKGADNVIFNLLSDKVDASLLETTQQHIDYYSTKGLRTLCYAQKYIKEDDYEEWRQQYHTAKTSLVDRKLKMEHCAKLIENDLQLLGATAIEDKLQDHVPETLQQLLRADVKVWVLTGDKRETAISIGKSCNLITQETKLFKLEATSPADCEKKLDKYLLWARKHPNVSIALVVDGKSLGFAFNIDNDIFLRFGMCCKTVICCRVSPIQKAQVVALVKKNRNDAVTLSIGDGANDVSMIQEADVGVGIRGREGSQASRSADFTIAKFHFLRRLMFIHGRYTYVRVAQLIQYSFYKNLSFTIIQFYFAFYNGFSGQTLFDSWVISVFNLFFTSFPIIIFAIFERDVPEQYLIQYPELYNRSKNNSDFNPSTFFFWVLNSIWHSIAFYFGALLIWEPVMHPNGQAYGIWSFGLIVSSACVITVTLKLAIDTLYWPWMMFFFSIGSVIVYFLFLVVYGFIHGLEAMDPLYYVFLNEGSSPTYWLMVLICIGFAIIPDFCVKWLRQHLYPKDWQILKEKILLYKKNKTETLDILSGGSIRNRRHKNKSKKKNSTQSDTSTTSTTSSTTVTNTPLLLTQDNV
eukprot:TRINITY_DN7599_c0_g2_i1.p1 TRINITY_DN7599_c0_g2~~TRINITY_DN7599_c0_g2_i1.p1  ORF type:complete len:1186 (-),score=234.52 TRINITY_DN7599_c0_g2_i1:63-3599(-)